MSIRAESKAEVLKTLREHSDELRRLGVHRVGLFGSFVRDEQTANSDIDLLIQFAPGRKSFENFMDVANLLESLLSRRVDVVTPEALSPYIAPHILSEVEYASLAS